MRSRSSCRTRAAHFNGRVVLVDLRSWLTRVARSFNTPSLRMSGRGAPIAPPEDRPTDPGRHRGERRASVWAGRATLGDRGRRAYPASSITTPMAPSSPRTTRVPLLETANLEEPRLAFAWATPIRNSWRAVTGATPTAGSATRFLPMARGWSARTKMAVGFLRAQRERQRRPNDNGRAGGVPGYVSRRESGPETFFSWPSAAVAGCGCPDRLDRAKRHCERHRHPDVFARWQAGRVQSRERWIARHPKQKLVVVDFNRQTLEFTSPLTVVDYTGQPAETRPGWPAFFPDGKSIVYHHQTKAGVDGNNLGDLRTRKGALARLYWNGLSGTETSTPLDRLNGFDENGNSYLAALSAPVALTCTGDGSTVGDIQTSHESDVDLNYEPTVNPCRAAATLGSCSPVVDATRTLPPFRPFVAIPAASICSRTSRRKSSGSPRSISTRSRARMPVTPPSTCLGRSSWPAIP